MPRIKVCLLLNEPIFAKENPNIRKNLGKRPLNGNRNLGVYQRSLGPGFKSRRSRIMRLFLKIGLLTYRAGDIFRFTRSVQR